jgi:hypothetical protein
MIGYYPRHCPFCGADREHFLTAGEVSRHYRVAATRVTDTVTMLRSEPPLGFEHAAYRIESGGRVDWIDCPSTFNESPGHVDRIMYTHHHFLGAGNLYRERAGAAMLIHRDDSEQDLCRGYTFDTLFGEESGGDGPERFHINGHTEGFTAYRHRDVLMLCDYVFYNGQRAKYNPYGPVQPTREGGRRIDAILREHDIRLVCGFDYTEEIGPWREKFAELLAGDVPAMPGR